MMAVLRIAGWEVDPAAHQLSRDGQQRHLEPRAMDVLVLLAVRAGSVVTRTELMTQVWGDTFITDDAVSATILKLRKAFGDDARRPRLIETVPKSGYRLIALVEHGDQDPGPGQPSRSSDPRIRHATVLRCVIDLHVSPGATPEPEAWQQAMTAHRDLLEGVAHPHGGWVAEEATALVAVFGAPDADEHHVIHAVATAIEVRDVWQHQPVPKGLEVVRRLALASGDLLATATAGDQKGSVFGEAMTVTVALAETAAADQIVLSEQAYALIGDRFDAEAQADTEHEAPASYVLKGRRPTASTWQARVLRGLSPLVGRAHELAVVEDVLSRAESGRGQVLALHGEPGVGKSRLLHELIARAIDAGFVPYTGYASALDRHSPYFAIQPIVRQSLAGRPEVDDELALASVLTPGTVNAEWQALDPELRHRRIVAAVSSLLLRDDVPTVLAVEDLHWADEATQGLLVALADRIARRRCLLVVTYRPELADPWPSRSYASMLRVDPLPVATAATLLDELTGLDSSLVRWKREVLDRAGGTPLFLEESVRSAQSLGALAGTPGGYEFRAGVDIPVVPSSLRGLLAERIDRLSTSARSLVSVAAVIGRQSPTPLLAAMVDLDGDQMAEVLRQLQAAEILFEVATLKEPTYEFKHALTQEAAYLGVPASLRRDLQRRIADLLTGELADQVSSTPEELAWHLAEAGRSEEALAQWRLAAAAATEAGAFTDALAHLAKARELLGAVTAPVARQHAELAIELATGTALIQTVGPTDEQVARAFRRATTLADEIRSPREQFEATWGSWFVQMMRGDIHAATRLADQVSAIAENMHDDALTLEAHHVQWSGLILAGQPETAAEHATAAIEMYHPEQHHWLTYSYGGHDPGVCAYNLHGLTQWLLGDATAARASSAAAQELAQRLGHPYTVLESTQTALTIALLDRDVAELVRLTEMLLALVADGRLPDVASGFADGFRGAAIAYGGELAKGLAVMRAAAPVWTEFWGAWCFPLDTTLAELMAASGELDAASAHVEQTMALARESGANWWDAELSRVRANLRGPAPAGQVGPTATRW